MTTIYLKPPRARDGRFAPTLERGVAAAMTAALRAALGYPDEDDPPEEIKSILGGIGSIARTTLGKIDWDPLLHPRDARGRFIHAGDRVIVDLGGHRSTIGQVIGNTPDSIIVATSGGGHAETAPGDVRVVGLAGPARSLARIPTTGTPTGRGTLDDPIDVGDDIEAAARKIAAGKHVRLTQPDQVAVLVDALHAMVTDAAASDGTIPNYDLALVTVPGTNLFTGGSVDRFDMPQLTGVPAPGSPASALPVAFTGSDGRGRVTIQPQFLDALRERGIDVTTGTMPASRLRPTQRQLSGVTTADVMHRIRTGKYTDTPLLVTRDGYIIDGHHRWAAQVALDTEHGGDADVPVDILDLDVGAALDFAREFASAMGMPARHAWPPHRDTPWDGTVTDGWRRTPTDDEARMMADWMETTATGLTSTVREGRINPPGHVAQAVAAITASDGTNAGLARATLDRGPDGFTLTLDHIVVFPQYQASGFGSAWTRQFVAQARAQGIDRIALEANLDVGGYVWAVRGFDWDRGQRDFHAARTWPRMARMLRDEARRSKDPQVRRETRDMAAWLTAAAADPDVEPPSPREVAMAGHTAAEPAPPHGMLSWPGKRVMLAATWRGVLDLEQEDPVNRAVAVPDIGAAVTPDTRAALATPDATPSPGTKALGRIAATTPDWDPRLHPRDAEGQWTETLGSITLPFRDDTTPRPKPAKAPPAPKSASMTPDELVAYRTDRDTGRMRPDPATLEPPPGWHDVTTAAERAEIARRVGRPIPPGWVRVWALDDWDGPQKIKVNGFADNWKMQPLQTKTDRATSLDEKFTRYRRVVAKRLRRLVTRARRDLARDETALAVAVMVATGARVGSTKGSGAEEHVGITSLRARHVTIDGATVTLTFNAKGHPNTYEFTDPDIAKALTLRVTGADPDDEVFPTVTDNRTMRYIRDAMGKGAEDVINHDIRTAVANSLAQKVLDQLVARDGLPQSKKDARTLKAKVADVVAAKLNDTRTVVVNNYIDPLLWGTLGYEV